MSWRTCSNSKRLGSTSPEARPQNMNASSGSGLWPRWISIGSAGGYQGRGGLTAATAPYTGPVSKPVLSDAIQDYLKVLYHLQSDGGRVSVTALAPGGERGPPAGRERHR